MKKNLVIDCRFWSSKHTGLGRYTKSLLTAIYDLKPKDINFKLLVSLANQTSIQQMFPGFSVIGTSVQHYSLEEQLKLPQLIKSLDPHLVHFLHFNVPVFFKGRFMVTIHDLIKHHSTGLGTTTRYPWVYPIKRFGYQLTVKHAAKNSLAVLTPSLWVKKDLTHFYKLNSDKIIVTPEAADSFFLKPIDKTANPPLKNPYLIYIGNAYPHKNLIQLVKAMLIFRQNHSSNIKLVIVTGRDIFYQRLRHQISDLKAQSLVKLTDFSTDEQLKNLFYHSLAFVTPSLLEGFGLPGLEAMASGTLVLSSNKASLPEVYGRSAIYFDPHSLKDVVNKIEKVVNLDPLKRKKMIAKARLHAQRFSWNKTAEKTLEIYYKLLS